MNGADRTPAPPSREQTIRRDLLEFLQQQPGASARELSMAIGIPEKSVADHLGHLQRSLRRQGQQLEILPPSCLDCEFVFQKRTRLTRPGRCPRCRSTHLSEPRFAIR